MSIGITKVGANAITVPGPILEEATASQELLPESTYAEVGKLPVVKETPPLLSSIFSS